MLKQVVTMNWFQLQYCYLHVLYQDLQSQEALGLKGSRGMKSTARLQRRHHLHQQHVHHLYLWMLQCENMSRGARRCHKTLRSVKGRLHPSLAGVMRRQRSRVASGSPHCLSGSSWWRECEEV